MAITKTTTPRHRDTINVSLPERWISAIAGGALLGYGLQKRSWGGVGLAALGGALMYRGATGHCDFYEALGIHANPASWGRHTSIPYELGIRVDQTITIRRPQPEIYRFWRNLENLPKVMSHLASVKEIDNKHSHWVAKAPAGRSVEWKAEIINEVENELIAWRSLDGDVSNAGSVRFQPAANGSGTILTVALQYNPPGGAVGGFVAKLFGEEPSQQIAEDLGRFRHSMETGEIPAASGQGPGCRPAQPAQKGWVRDAVGQASEESFPASDPPSWTPEELAH